MNEEVVRELEPFYEEICRNSKRFTKTNEDAPNYIDVDKVLELVNKYDAINKKQLEQRDNIISASINKYIKEYEQKIDFEIDMGSQGEYKKIKCYEEFINKLNDLKNILEKSDK